ncbi:MAG TPA: putative addiction module antidote protein [Pyrinomonadaceae bacterium]|nr:putative addiction module antidote protein [Pyrinomonadaceae bacterium]
MFDEADGEPTLIVAALGDIARARGMTRVARKTGLGRESLYKALSPAGNPEFSTIIKVLAALGFRLHASTVNMIFLLGENDLQALKS